MEKETRPWGKYEVLKQEDGIWVKRIEVNPGSRLSLQKHFHRSETWVIVKGEGMVQLDDEDTPVERNSVIRIDVEQAHRIENTGKEPLVFIEIAFGDQLTEEDISRIEDDYDRC